MLSHFGFTGISGDEANEVQGVILAATALRATPNELDDETLICVLVKTALINDGEFCSSIDNAIDQTIVYDSQQNVDEGLYLEWAEDYAQDEVNTGSYQDECPDGKYNTNTENTTTEGGAEQQTDEDDDEF